MPSLFFLSPAKRSRQWDVWAVVAIGLALVVYGAISEDLGLVNTLGTVFMYVVLTQAWNILGGYGGYLNFGMVTYFGVGAYTTALFYQYFQVSPFLTTPLAGVAAAIFGILIGIPTLRLRGAYFAVVTMIITFAVQIAVLAFPFTQGAMGVYLSPLSLDPRAVEQLFYFVFFGLAVVTTILVYGIEHSNFGWALVAIREDEDAAEIIGVRTTEIKWIANALAAFLTGIAGGIYAERVLYIEPTSTFALDISLNVVLMAVIGGAASWKGPLIGAPLVLLVAQFLRVTITSEANRAIFSVIVILIALYVPAGVIGMIEEIRRRRACAAPSSPRWRAANDAQRHHSIVEEEPPMSLTPFIATPKFEDYKERFKNHYKLERRADGVILAQAHTVGGPIQLSVENHRSVGQLFKTIGADPENEIMIFTGSGEDFMMAADPEGFKLEQEDLAYWAYEYAYKDGRINVSSLINDLEIPTIGVLNGPGFHTEMCLMCDITICAEDAIIYDLHYDIGSVPGDGIHSCFQELLGVKRAAYALLTGQTIDAKTALEYGMVNEIWPREKLLERAWKIADHIMTQPRTTRRLTTQIVRRPWRQRITDNLDGGFGIQMFAHLAKKKAVHGKQHIGDTVAYVRKGKRNNFD